MEKLYVAKHGPKVALLRKRDFVAFFFYERCDLFN